MHAFGSTKAGMPVFKEGDISKCRVSSLRTQIKLDNSKTQVIARAHTSVLVTVLLNQDSAVPYVQFYRNGELAIPRPKGSEGVKISSFTGHGKRKEVQGIEKLLM